jgi:hypothetical protein
MYCYVLLRVDVFVMYCYVLLRVDVFVILQYMKNEATWKTSNFALIFYLN